MGSTVNDCLTPTRAGPGLAGERQLTERQLMVYQYIYGYARDKGFQPSCRELQIRFSWKSTNAVAGVITDLERKGYVRKARRDDGVRVRGVEFVLRPDGTPFRGFAEKV